MRSKCPAARWPAPTVPTCLIRIQRRTSSQWIREPGRAGLRFACRTVQCHRSPGDTSRHKRKSHAAEVQLIRVVCRPNGQREEIRGTVAHSLTRNRLAASSRTGGLWLANIGTSEAIFVGRLHLERLLWHVCVNHQRNLILNLLLRYAGVFVYLYRCMFIFYRRLVIDLSFNSFLTVTAASAPD